MGKFLRISFDDCKADELEEGTIRSNENLKFVCLCFYNVSIEEIYDEICNLKFFCRILAL